MALLLAGRGEELCFQRRVGQLGWQRPAQPGDREPLQRQPDRRRGNADPAGDLVAGHPGGIQPKHVAHLAHRDPVCWHRPLPWQKPKERTLSGPAEPPLTGRLHPGMAGEIISERRATSNRNGGRDHPGIPGDFPRNPHAVSPLPQQPDFRLRLRRFDPHRGDRHGRRLARSRRQPVRRLRAFGVAPAAGPKSTIRQSAPGRRSGSPRSLRRKASPSIRPRRSTQWGPSGAGWSPGER